VGRVRSGRVIRGVIVLGLGRGMQALAGLMIIRVATELLPPDTMGYVAQTTSLIWLISWIGISPVCVYVGRAYLGWRNHGLAKARLTQYLVFVTMAAVSAAILLLLTQSGISAINGLSALALAALGLLYFLGYPLQTVGVGCLILLGRRVSYAIFGNLAMWGGLLCAVALFHRFSNAESWLAGIFLGNLTAALSFLLVLRVAEQSDHSGTPPLPFSFREVFDFAWPQALTAALWWSQSQSYRFVLGDLGGPALVGLFAAGYTVCAGVMQTLEALFNEIYNPKLYRTLADGNDAVRTRAWNDYASAYLPAVMLFGAFVTGMVPFLGRVLLAERYHAVLPLLFIPALTETLRSMYTVINTMGVVKVNMKLTVMPVVVGAFLSPILVYVCGTSSPLWGTALGLLLAYLAVFLATIPVTRAALPISWPVRRMMTAAVFGAPMIAVGHFLPRMIEATLGLSIAVLALGALYMAGVQYILSRPWLGQVFHLEKGN